MSAISVGPEDSLIVVDLQVDFCPGGALAQRGQRDDANSTRGRFVDSPGISLGVHENKMGISYNGSFDMNQTLLILSKSGYEISRTNTIEASLEDVFIKLAG